MSTLSQLKTARTAAGATYVSALAAFKTAYVALDALDRTLQNGNIDGTPLLGFPHDHTRMNDAVRIFAHAQYAPEVQDWEDQVLSTSAAQIAAFTPG
jgi:hypothetical protein